MPKTNEDRVYRYFQSLRRNPRYRDFRRSHYSEGWIHGPYMEVARTFGIPIRTVRDILDARKASENKNN